jgi:hypothetical protein
MHRHSSFFVSFFAAALCVSLLSNIMAPDDALAQSGRRSKGRSGSTPQGSGSYGDPLGGASENGSDSEMEEFAKETDLSLHSLAAGRASIDVGFPGGGSPNLDGSAGLRLVLSNRLAVGLSVLAGIDKQAKKNAYGGALRLQNFFPTTTRAFPYFAVSLTGGKNSGEGNKLDSETKGGAGLSLGAEVFVMKEISLSAEVGVTSQILPGKSFALATGTSQLAAHLFFGN